MKRILNFNSKYPTFKYIVAPLIKYFEMPDVEDLQIKNYGEIYLIKKNDIRETIKDENITENFIKNLMNTVMSYNGTALLNDKEERISAMLPINYFRFTGLIGKKLNSGVQISIRLNDNELLYSYKDYNLTEEEYIFLLKYITKNKANVFMVGETGSGKTSFANLFISDIKPGENVFIVGDISDYVLPKNHTPKPTEIKTTNLKEWEDTINSLMRSNPDRILVPELTTHNVNGIIRILNSGHKGTILTLHANINGVAQAFKTNLSLNGMSGNVEELDIILKKNVDFIIYLSKSKGKRFIGKIDILNSLAKKEADELNLFNNMDTDKNIINNIPKSEPEVALEKKDISIIPTSFTTKSHKKKKKQGGKKKKILSKWDLTKADELLSHGLPIASVHKLVKKDVSYSTFYRRIIEYQKEKGLQNVEN